MSGFIAYRGVSAFTSTPIVVIVTQGSGNRKTGDMDQAWIIPAITHPFHATRTGEDAAVCSTCRHRGVDGKRSCYVTVQHGPAAIWRAFLNGVYPDADRAQMRSFLRGRFIRLGAYGDPAAAPFWLWRSLADASSGWTGYTHFWRDCDQRFRRLLMASVDTEDEHVEATGRGWRTFRVRQTSRLMPGEIVCPASEEGGKRTTCEKCRLCSGTTGKADCTIAILPHGPKTTFYRSSNLALNWSETP